MYRVEVDGHTIHDPRDEHFILPYAKLDLELNKTGSFEFDITTENPGYEYVSPMKSVISVYDDGKLIFRGRSTTEEKDFYNTGTLKCEGELSYLIDTILRPRTTGFINQTNRYIFREIVKEHNTQVGIEKQFQPGIIDIDEVKTDILSFNYETPLDFINTNLIEKYKGYLRIRYVDGKRYLDWVKQYGEVSQQEIRFGYNLLDLKKTLVSTDVCTVVVPVGGSDKKVTIKNAVVNGKTYGKDYLQNDEAVNYFGKIIKVQEFTDVVDPNTLYAEGEKWLLENMKSSLTVELTALDLHMVDANIDDFKLGDLVKVASVPHSIVFKDDLPVIEKYSYDITDPSKNTITVGKTLKVFTERKDPVIYDKVQEVTGKFEGYVETTDGKIEEITNDIQEYKTLVIQDFTAVNGSIEQLTSKHADFETATAENFISTNAKISNLSGDFASFKTGEFETLKAQQAKFENATAENFTAVRAEIDNILIRNLDADYARIDFANIDTAKIKQGFMENLMVSQGIFTSDITAAEGTFTNYLTGVNILANNITAGTLSVERLIITGSDQSIVYEINKANGTPQLSQSTVDGGALTERTVTADRIVAESITGNEIAATTITGQHIVGNTITADKLAANTITADSACIGSLNASKITSGTLSADRIDVNGLFAKNITATGTITGAKLVGATGSFSGSINSTNAIISGGSIRYTDGSFTCTIDTGGLKVERPIDGVPHAAIVGHIDRSETPGVSCEKIIVSGYAYVDQIRFNANSSYNYISIGNYNGWNNYYYAAGYHAFYCNGNGIAYIRPDGISMGNYDIQFNIGHGIKYGGEEWILRPYKSGDYNVTALGNGNRRTVLYGSQVRLNSSTGTTVTSDRRLKKDFRCFDERHEKFFMSLMPTTYRMAYEKNSNEYKRTNGFVAQDVERALINAGLKPEELDMISCDTADQEYLSEMFNGHPPDIQKQYSLNYNNFISLNTYMIQKTRNELNYQVGRIDIQESVINDLQNRLWKAEKEIKQLKQAAQ